MLEACSVHAQKGIVVKGDDLSLNSRMAKGIGYISYVGTFSCFAL